jgi:putative ABC transport system permease protein
MFAAFTQDVRYAIRQMRKSPGFALVVVLTLSLGIGAAAAVFSVIDAVLLRALPFAHQERLVYPYMISRSGGSEPASYLSYLDERAQVKTFDALAGYSTMDNINMVGANGPVSLHAVKGTDNFFDVFGVKPILGRTYLPGEDQPGKDNLAVLSFEVWKTYFNGAQDVVGKTVNMDGSPYTVIGVMPAGFRFPMFMRDAVYTPLHAKESWKKARGMHWLKTVGLIKEGVTAEQAQQDVSQVMVNLGRAYPEQEAGHRVKLVPLAEQTSELQSGAKASGPLGMLALACLALLGIACVNVAGLLLARGVKREREMALRAAVGAARARLVRQMLSESVVLSVVGLAGGLVVSSLLLRAMNTFLVGAMARGADVHLNWIAVSVALGLSALTSIAASLAPAIRLSGTDPNRALRAGGSAGTGLGQHRLRSAFVITQVALSLVLLVLSGLLLKNLQGMLKTDVGFDAQKIVAVNINLSPGRYRGLDPLTSFYNPMLERVSHLPGVQAAGVIDLLPIAEWGDGYEIHITGQAPYPKDQAMGAETRYVSPGYFAAMGIQLKDGRMLSSSFDKAENLAGTMVVNDAFKRKFFAGGGEAVGAHIDDADKAENKSGIVGVTTSIHQDLLQAPMPEMDWLMDEVNPKDRLATLGSMFLVVRTSGDTRSLIPALRNAIYQVDPTLPFKAFPMTEVVGEQTTIQQLESWLFGIFASFALLLAVIGIYGLIHHEVELRTKEIGIRMAVGSTRELVMTSVLRRVAVLMAMGIAAGWVLTIALQKMVSAVIVMHAGQDAGLLALLTVTLALVGLMSGAIPALKAARLDPMRALRNE